MAYSYYQQHIFFLRQEMELHPEWRETLQQQINVVVLNLEPGDIDYVPPAGNGSKTPPPPPVSNGSNTPAYRPPPTTPQALSGEGADSTDSKTKLEYLRPTLEAAAAAAGVPFEVLAALVLMEGQGVSVNQLSNPAWNGVAQIGEVEVEEERRRHPGLIPEGPWYSPEVQVWAAAFKLADNYGNEPPGSQWTGWDYAMARYNGGETGPVHLNRADYIELYHKFRDQIDSGGPIDS